MSAPAAEPKPQASMPKRWGIGLNVFIQVLLTLALFMGVNRLSYRYHTRWDLSPQQTYTLTSSTLNTLGKLSMDVYIDAVFPRDSKESGRKSLYGDVQPLLEEYRINGRGRVRVRMIDPVHDIERTEALKAEIRLPFEQNGIVIRAGSRMRFITEEELVVRDAGTETQRRIKEFRGEDAVTSAIINVVEGKERRFYIVMGKGTRTELALVEAMDALKDLGRQLNYQLLGINLSEVNTIPEDADGLIFCGVRYDLSERELAMVKRYWEGKRAGLLVMLDPGVAEETKRLNSFMAMHGVRPRPDRVLYAESTSSGTRKEYTVQAGFDNESPITRPLAASTTSFPGQTQSLEVRYDDEYLRNQNIQAHPLVGATDRYWGEVNHYENLPVVDEEDTREHVFLAASVERGIVTDPRLRKDTCRMVIVGNCFLLDKKTAISQNRDLVAASLNWILNRDSNIGIMPKPKHSYRIQLSQRQSEIIFWSTAIVLPAVVLCLGMMVWASRRAA